MNPPRKWNVLNVAAWGAALGALYATFNLIGRWGPSYMVGALGEIAGSAAGGALIFGLIALARNQIR